MIAYERLWQSEEVAEYKEKTNATPRENYRQISLTFKHGKVTEEIILEATYEHMKNQKVARNSHHAFMKEISYFIW